MRKENKEETAKRIIQLGKGNILKCLKLESKEIFLPKWECSNEAEKSMVTNCVQLHNSCTVGSKEFWLVMRFVGNQAYWLTDEERVDPLVCYQLQNTEKLPKIGCQSPEALLALLGVMNNLVDTSQRLMVANFFSGLARDFIMVTSYMQAREFIQVSEELYQKGLRFCVDEWTPTDKEGNGKVTEINIGDYVVISRENPLSVFCVRRKEFERTHSFGWC